MSDTDPYAAPVIEEANPEVLAETPAVEPVDGPVAETPAVPEGSIKEILAWVGDDATKAQAALDAENNGDQRSTLISKLEAIIN